MHRNLISNVVVPILFVSVASLSAIFAAIHSQQKQIKHIPTETQTESLEEVCTPDNPISEYDAIFKEIGAKYELDWLLLAAIANTESRFQADAKSPVGARGLMQVMPHVAHNMGYSKKELYDVQINVEVAALLLIENKKMLHLSKRVDEDEALKFLLACYNAGYSRISDARSLAKYFDADTNDWNIVGLFLSWLSDPEFSDLEIVEAGPFYGSQETLDYVERVTETYRKYQEISKE